MRSASDLQTSLNSVTKSMCSERICMALASTLESSRMSLTRRRSMSQLLWMMRIISRFSSGDSMVCNKSEKPTMAFNGVRISWVILARKTDFWWPESLARSVSRFSCSCLRIMSLMLRQRPKLPFSLPCSSYSGMLLICTHCNSVVDCVMTGCTCPT